MQWITRLYRKVIEFRTDLWFCWGFALVEFQPLCLCRCQCRDRFYCSCCFSHLRYSSLERYNFRFICDAPNIYIAKLGVFMLTVTSWPFQIMVFGQLNLGVFSRCRFCTSCSCSFISFSLWNFRMTWRLWLRVGIITIAWGSVFKLFLIILTAIYIDVKIVSNLI